MYGNENNVTFRRKTPRLQRTGSSVPQVFNSVRKKVFLVASLTSFSPRQFLERIVTADESWLHHYEPESKAQIWLGNTRYHPWLRNSKVNHQPVKLCLHFLRDMEVRFWMGHPPYSPDLAPSDFYMFGTMKEALKRRFSSDEVISAVENWLKTQPKKLFFLTELKKLVKLWDRCVEVEGGLR
jgi:hypothetical protein